MKIRTSALPKYCKLKEGSKYTGSKYCVAIQKFRTNNNLNRWVWTPCHYAKNKVEALVSAKYLADDYPNTEIVIYKMR